MGPTSAGSRGARQVEVLLSTYNPNDYLAELLDSLRRQTHRDVTLSVRDDGSEPESRRLLEQLLAEHGNSRLTWGSNIGPTGSFLALLGDVRPSASYAAFCDQDDVWNKEKLEVATDVLDGVEGPTLYCSAVELATPELEPITVHRRCVRGPAFANALVENIATGCTIVFNRPAIDLIASRPPQRAVMHDAWSYLVVSGCGTVIYDPQPRVLYRLHEENAVGVATNLASEVAQRIRRQLRSGRDRLLTAQAEELRALFGAELSTSAARDLAAFLDSERGWVDRATYVFSGGAFRQRRVDDIIFRLLYLAHRV